MKVSNKVISIQNNPNTFDIQTDGAKIRLMFMTDDILRIRASFDSNPAFKEASYSLAMTAWEDELDEFMKDYRKRITPASYDIVSDDEARTILQGNSLRVEIEKEPFRICVYDKENSLIHADIPDLAYQLDSNRRIIHTSQIEADDAFYGFGEKSGELNKAEKRMNMSPKDAMGYNPEETDSLYKHIPFYIKANKSTHKAVGYFYHNTWECEFDMGRSKSNYWHRHSSYKADGGDIDLFLINGPEISSVVKRYTDLTGKSAMLPRYALGYLGSSMYYPELPENCDDAILEFIDTTREEGIPADGFQLSSGYCAIDTPEGIKRCVFTWNNKRFKDPKAWFAAMKERGIGVSPNVKPGLLLVHPNIEDFKAKDMLVKSSDDAAAACEAGNTNNTSNTNNNTPAVGTWWGGKGHFVDFTKKSTRENWKEMLKKNVLEYGTSSVWNDNCEYDSIVDKDAKVYFEGNGATIAQLKSVMSSIMCHITKEAIDETFEDERPYIVCRSGHAGIQKYAQTWAGDNLTCWEALKYNIPTILGMSLSGVANQGCDIGGFYGPAPEKELFVRWIQNGIFQPRFSIHSTNTDNTVTEPWMYSDVKNIIREAIKFRYRLTPLYYSLMEQATHTGEPIMRPMVYEFPEDEKSYDNSFDFMIGKDLLVANVLDKGAKTRKVWLPENNTFYNFWTRERYAGGQEIEVDVDLSSVPMFVRAGAIVPMAKNQIHNMMKEDITSLEILCVPDKDGEFDLYEDDGNTNKYKAGGFLKTHIDMKAGTRTLLTFTNTGSYQTKIQGILLDVIHTEKSPYFVLLDNQEIPHFLHRRKFEEAETGWYYSQSKKSVLIKYPNPKKEKYTVDISFEVFDMIGM